MTSPPSLRDLYSDPSTTWSFVPPPISGPQTNTTPSTSSGSSYQWSTRPSHNSIFDLSPSLDLSEPSGVNVSLLLKSLVASAILQYTSSAIAMPWEVGKLLLQVQWVPRDAGEESPCQNQDEDEEVLSESSNDNESYFAEPGDIPTQHGTHKQPEDYAAPRRSVFDERPEYMIPVGSADGVWRMIKRIGQFRGEGWFALWKGLLTSCVTDIISTTIQPIIHNILQPILYPTSPFHQHSLLLPVASHVITGFILSPLDLVRTRLIVQSFVPRYRTYSGPLDALSQILRDEGGIKGIYLHPQLLIPTILDTTLRPLVSLVLPGMLTSSLGLHISEDSNPMAWGLVELTASCIGLLVTLPFETVRRRLQAQVRGSAKPIKTCVETRPAPYNGVVDAFWHILTEERSDLPIERTARRRHSRKKGKIRLSEDGKAEDEGWLRHTGIGQLYRGLGMRLGASAIVFLLALFSGGDEGDGGWAEL